MGAKISVRDCETRLGVSEIKNREARLLQGYIDADYAGDLDQRRSMMGYVFTVVECVISWKAWLIIALSTAEAEYMAVVEASKKACG